MVRHGAHVSPGCFVSALFAAATSTLIACGPVEYMADVSGRASAVVAQARREGAKDAAPYEMTTAELYLARARTEAGRSEYELALTYGRRAEAAAIKALALSRARPGSDDPRQRVETPLPRSAPALPARSAAPAEPAPDDGPAR